MTHHDLMHGIDYAGQRVSGWLVQEKFNGLRALWTGRELVSRTGQRFNAPGWFTAGLPDCPLDCELYGGVGTLARLSTRLARWKSGRDEDWQGARLKVFDAPEEPGGYLSRWQSVHAWLPRAGFHIQLAAVREIESLSMLARDLERLQNEGGEGFMLRDPSAPYVAGRSDRLLKFKDSNR